MIWEWTINNRDLNTFEIDLSTSTELITQIPKEILVVAEGGIRTREDVALMNSSDINAFLLGETLIQATNSDEKLAELFN